MFLDMREILHFFASISFSFEKNKCSQQVAADMLHAHMIIGFDKNQRPSVDKIEIILTKKNEDF